ncbi:MAG: tetratricopeptide repeat protein, partial [Muribaculaceae bacterium]|nr:tetratricopeptide repeat protein [Muribaculaceae bacterium]
MKCRLIHILLLPLWSLLFASCSTSKNTAASRNYNAFITRYNIYYNGDTHFRQTLEDMEKKYEDDYSRLLFMHPVEAKADKDAPQPSGNFDRSIEKGQKAIQLRSIKKRPRKKAGRNGDAAYQAWLKRDEYNPFMHNAWMMMGRSQYYNGDFMGAASTFFYVSRHFTWLPATVTEAKLWQARCYVAMDWLYDAEMILERIKPDQLTSKSLRGLYNFTRADRLLRGGMYAEAVEPLRLAIAAAGSDAQRTRLRFLLGQVLERLGRRKEAYEAFAKAGASPSASYRTKFNARIKQSEVYEGTDIQPEVKALKRMTHYDRNKPYLDQIYYAIGNLYLSRRDTAQAIANYETAVEKSTRSGIDKALAQLRLGGLYFDRRDYAKAQPHYSEAMPQLPKNYPGYDSLRRRSDVLDELAVYAQNVELQDSLLRLSNMTPEERLEVVQGIIKRLIEREKKEAEEARRAEYEADVAARGQENNAGAANAPNAFNINTDNSWYFYNQSAKQAGRTEFQKRWGSRKLEDDWRRRNKNTFSNADFDEVPAGDSDEDVAGNDSIASPEDEAAEAARKAADEAASDPHNPEYYLRQIPDTTEEARAVCHEIIQDGLYNMGAILKDRLEDYPGAKVQWARLLRDYPDNVHRLDVYYNSYLMNARRGDNAEAERWRNMILTDFAESTYGVAMQNPDYLDNLRNMEARQQQLYEATLEAYMDNRNDDVHRAYEEMNSNYPLSAIMPKFMFLHALSYVPEKNADEFNATLRDMLNRYPDTDLTPIASAWLKGMAQGRKLQTDAGNLRGMVWDMRLTNDSTAMAQDGPAQFVLNPDTAQVMVLLFPTDSVSSNVLLYEVARHNFRSFVVKDFELEPMNFGRLGLLVIRGFANMNELNHYRRVMASSPDFKLPAGVRPV